MADPCKNTARRAMLAKVHIATKALGMAEDDYRALLFRLTGKRSAGACQNQELQAMVSELERRGFNSKSAFSGRTRIAGHPVARKARAMWICLYELGVIRDRSERALETFGKRQLGVDRLHWADQSQGYRLIEALKALAARHGWDQRIPVKLDSEGAGRLLRRRLVLLLASRIEAVGSQPGIIGVCLEEAGADQLDELIGRLGRQLRECSRG